MPKVIIIAGTRPEVIKVAPVLLELQKNRSHIETIFCCTGQHRELLNGLFDLFGLTVDYNLDILLRGKTHFLKCF